MLLNRSDQPGWTDGAWGIQQIRKGARAPSIVPVTNTRGRLCGRNAPHPPQAHDVAQLIQSPRSEPPLDEAVTFSSITWRGRRPPISHQNSQRVMRPAPRQRARSVPRGRSTSSDLSDVPPVELAGALPSSAWRPRYRSRRRFGAPDPNGPIRSGELCRSHGVRIRRSRPTRWTSSRIADSQMRITFHPPVELSRDTPIPLHVATNLPHPQFEPSLLDWRSRDLPLTPMPEIAIRRSRPDVSMSGLPGRSGRGRSRYRKPRRKVLVGDVPRIASCRCSRGRRAPLA